VQKRRVGSSVLDTIVRDVILNCPAQRNKVGIADSVIMPWLQQQLSVGIAAKHCSPIHQKWLGLVQVFMSRFSWNFSELAI